MSEEIKSGKDVTDDFFAEIYNIENVDEKTADILVSLYSDGKLTDRNIQNALDELIQVELDKTDKENDEN